tara:strand:+ start:551 stop:1852 length:1302 start_codon:yes stop_codon:yes gene_type:complete
MKFSIGNKSSNETSLDITIPSEEIENKVASKISSTQKTVKIKGFRKGKAPLNVVTKFYGPEIRQDVIYDSAISFFYDKVKQKGLKPVGRPNLVPQRIEEGKDVKFKATFATYPEVRVNNLRRLSYKKIICSIDNDDLDNTILNLQKRLSEWDLSEDSSVEGDRVKVNFIGTIDGEEFEGSKAEDAVIEIGSKSMIEGFEEGLLGLKSSEKKTLNLSFPEDYFKKDLASKKVEFSVEIKEVLKPKLPELNSEFFNKAGVVAENEEEFRKQIRKKLEEDLENLLRNKIKQNLFDALIENNSFQIPKVMIEAELESLKQNTAKRLGLELKDFEEGNFPMDSLEEEAEKRVRIGVILNQLIEDKSLKPDPDRVKGLIEQRASMYKEPQQVINWFYSNEEQLQNIEAISLEEQVVDIMLEESSPVEEQMTYEECITGN